MRHPRKLLLQRLNMVRVYMSVTHRVNELTSLEPTDLGKHARHQSVARDIEWNPEA